MFAWQVFGEELSLWTLGFLVIGILAPTVFVRNISIFSFTFLLGNLCILTTIVAVSYVFSGKLLVDGVGPDVEWITADYAIMVGFACYAFEGIGVVLPIMQVCECPEKFDGILVAALLTLTTIYIGFGELCYFTLGSGMTQ